MGDGVTVEGTLLTTSACLFVMSSFSFHSSDLHFPPCETETLFQQVFSECLLYTRYCCRYQVNNGDPQTKIPALMQLTLSWRRQRNKCYVVYLIVISLRRQTGEKYADFQSLPCSILWELTKIRAVRVFCQKQTCVGGISSCWCLFIYLFMFANILGFLSLASSGSQWATDIIVTKYSGSSKLAAMGSCLG